MPAKVSTRRRNLTPPEIAERYGVAIFKVLGWIRKGELKALNLANKGCLRPRYSVTPESLADFELSRTVVPDGGQSATQRLRRKALGTAKDYFPG